MNKRKNKLQLIFTPLLIVILLILCITCSSAPDRQSNVSISPYKIGNRNVSPNARRLMNYLEDIYGQYIISGQMDTTWSTNGQSDMISRVFADTGKYPAIKGFDLMEIPISSGGFGQQQIDEAIEWWEGKNRVNSVNITSLTTLLPDQPDIHGIVTFCWHWRMPAFTGNVPQFYSGRTGFRIPWRNGRLDTRSADFRLIMEDLDKAAALLQQLKDLDIPVLWRPLHEAAGNWTLFNSTGAWFWWGASGPQPYIALWEFMHDYFTNVKNLDNLIWVWNGQNEDWYPNPDTVDIAGYDYYPWPRNTPQTAQNYNSQISLYRRTRNMAEGQRMVAMTENGAIPDPDKCKEDGAMWLWFMVWNDGQRNNWIAQNGKDHADNFWSGEFHNIQAHKEHVYNHDLVITLDKLPDLTNYRLE